jgi:hypothetical protein
MKTAAQTQSGTRFAAFQERLLVESREKWPVIPTIARLRILIS